MILPGQAYKEISKPGFFGSVLKYLADAPEGTYKDAVSKSASIVVKRSSGALPSPQMGCNACVPTVTSCHAVSSASYEVWFSVCAQEGLRGTPSKRETPGPKGYKGAEVPRFECIWALKLLGRDLTKLKRIDTACMTARL